MSEEFLLHEDDTSEEGTDTEQSLRNNENSNNTEYTDDVAVTSRQEQNGAAESLRQRKNRPSCEVHVI